MNNKEKRAKRILNKIKDQSINQKEDKWKAPKNWKHVYLRSEKLRRAKQLGFDYPVKTNSKLLNENK